MFLLQGARTSFVTLGCVVACCFTPQVQAQAPVPEIAFDANANLLKLTDDIPLGEVAGVATNSKGNLFVYTRTGTTNATTGTSRTFIHGGSRLFEFDGSGKFVREIGNGVYGLVFAENVRIDAQDNIWVVDRGSSQILKFSPDGRIAMVLGRKPEAVAAPVAGPPAAGGGRAGTGAGVPGDNFVRPTGIAFDGAGNIFIADGYGNSRVAKFDKNGKFLKSWGTKGAGPGQFDVPRSIATDAQGNVYVADAQNKRIQVFDTEGTFKIQISNVGRPWAICISQGAHPYLYSSNSNDPRNLDNGEIYKLELDGRVLGKFGRAGKLPKEFGTVNEIDCRSPNDLFVAEVGNWRIQKLTLH